VQEKRIYISHGALKSQEIGWDKEETKYLNLRTMRKTTKKLSGLGLQVWGEQLDDTIHLCKHCLVPKVSTCPIFAAK
jgi:hypothetical protein